MITDIVNRYWIHKALGIASHSSFGIGLRVEI